MSNSLSSAEAIGNNESLLSEILVRLPPTSLLRFKCVSKPWLFLISSPHFIATHVRRHATPAPSGILLHDYLPGPGPHYIPLTHSNRNGPPYLSYIGAPCLKIEQSCNGLLLCSSVYMKEKNFEVEDIDIDLEIRYCVCNPTTRQFKTLYLPGHSNQEKILSVSLAFDPSHSPYFKVVCIERKVTCSVHIYDSRTDTWKSSLAPFNLPTATYFETPVFCRRAIHWCSWEQTSFSFDVDKECFNPMPMPIPQPLAIDGIYYFGESRGHLHLIFMSASDVQFDVLELAEDYSSWFVRYHVNLDALRVEFNLMYGIPSNQFKFSILSVVRAEREEVSEIIISMFGMVVSYNFKDGSLQKLMLLFSGQETGAPGSNSVEYKWWNVYPFIQTLCPI